MNRTVLLFLFLTVVLLPLHLGAGGPQQQDELNSILASVNGEPISLNDVLPITRNKEYEAYAAFSGARLRQEILKLRTEAVNNLIDRKLILEDYKKQTFTIPERDVESELDQMAQRIGASSRSDFRRRLRAAGQDYDKIREEVREYLIVQVMLYRNYRSGEGVTPKELYEYFKAHPEKFSHPESIELAMIMLAPDRPDLAVLRTSIAAALAQEPDRFDEFARKYSSVTGLDGTGRIGWIERPRLRPEFAAALPGKAAAGSIYGPVETADGTAFLRVLEVKPAQADNFEAASGEIRRELEQQRNARRRKAYTLRLREEAVIRTFFAE